MSHIRLHLAAMVFAGLIGAGAAFAQTPASPTSTPAPAVSAPTVQQSMATQVENWTTKQWNAAKSEWSKDTAKWNGCQQQSTNQKLTGRKSWAVLYQCMTS